MHETDANHENSVELVGHYGGDEAHALSAWTSTSRELTAEKIGRIPQMLARLAKDGHHTPFEKSALHFLVVCDKASHIHIIKHRIGVSVNGESARYKELKDDRFYVPTDWPADLRETATGYIASMNDAYHDMVAALEARGFARSRAKESARMLLPHAAQIVQDVQFNFRSFMHFVGLRADAHAQREIRQISALMLLHTWRMLDDRGAPPWPNSFRHSLAAFGWTVERIWDLCREVLPESNRAFALATLEGG